MPEKITPTLLAQLVADNADERLEHLVHPEEPQYEVVIRTPRLAEFKKWRAGARNARGEASERLMSLCLVYPSAAQWDEMLNDRPGLADTFGADIPKLIGATEESCVADEPSVLAPFEESGGKGNFRHLRHPRYPDCSVVIRRPKRDAYKRFKDFANSNARKDDATETLLIDCVVSPSLEEWKLMVDRMPGLVDSFGAATTAFAGASGEFTGKK